MHFDQHKRNEYSFVKQTKVGSSLNLQLYIEIVSFTHNTSPRDRFLLEYKRANRFISLEISEVD